MGAQADELRRKATAIFQAQRHPGLRDAPPGVIARQIGRDLPTGIGRVLRASWLSVNGQPENFELRGWMPDPSGRMLYMSGFGISLRPTVLPGLAGLIAEALDQLEVTDWSRLRPSRDPGPSTFAPPAATAGAAPSDGERAGHARTTKGRE
jgi:hypothetical protein